MTLNTNKVRVFGLDLMRALAIILVVFGNCLWIYPNATGLVASVAHVFAFLGVEIFFVLSGFLIGSIVYRLYVDEGFTRVVVFRFLKRRWFRTLPAYYLAVLLNVFIAYIVASPVENIGQYLIFIQNFNTPMSAFFLESWSLSVEEYSYLILPFCLLFFSVFFKPKNRSRFFALVVCVLILLSFIARISFHSHTQNTDIMIWNMGLKSVVIYRLDSIFMGVLCSWIAINFKASWVKYKSLFFLLGFLSIGFLFVGIGYFQILMATHPLFWNVFYLPLVSVAIAFFLPLLSEWKTFDSRLSKPIRFISVISYAIYLLHYSIILQLMKNFIVIDPHNKIGLHIFTVVYCIITLTASFLMYRFFEKPIMDLRDRN